MQTGKGQKHEHFIYGTVSGSRVAVALVGLTPVLTEQERRRPCLTRATFHVEKTAQMRRKKAGGRAGGLSTAEQKHTQPAVCAAHRGSASKQVLEASRQQCSAPRLPHLRVREGGVHSPNLPARSVALRPSCWHAASLSPASPLQSLSIPAAQEAAVSAPPLRQMVMAALAAVTDRVRTTMPVAASCQASLAAAQHSRAEQSRAGGCYGSG